MSTFDWPQSHLPDEDPWHSLEDRLDDRDAVNPWTYHEARRLNDLSDLDYRLDDVKVYPPEEPLVYDSVPYYEQPAQYEERESPLYLGLYQSITEENDAYAIDRAGEDDTLLDQPPLPVHPVTPRPRHRSIIRWDRVADVRRYDRQAQEAVRQLDFPRIDPDLEDVIHSDQEAYRPLDDQSEADPPVMTVEDFEQRVVPALGDFLDATRPPDPPEFDDFSRQFELFDMQMGLPPGTNGMPEI